MPLVFAQQADRVWNGSALARLNRQTGAMLKQIEENPGVTGAFVCDNHGSLLGARFATTPAQDALEQAGRRLVQTLAVVELCGGRPKEVELRYDQAGLFVRDLGNAFGAVQCNPDANWALLRIAVNVSAAPFEKDAELQESLYRIAPTRADAFNVQPDSDGQRWIWRMGMAGGVPVQSPPSANGSKPVDLMIRFAGLLIQELASHGFDLDSLLQVVEQRLGALTVKYPLLKSARVADRTLDLSAIQVASTDFGDFVAGWAELMWEIHASSVLKLGRNPAETMFRRVYETIIKEDGQAFRNMALALALRNIRMGGDAAPMGSSV